MTRLTAASGSSAVVGLAGLGCITPGCTVVQGLAALLGVARGASSCCVSCKIVEVLCAKAAGSRSQTCAAKHHRCRRICYIGVLVSSYAVAQIVPTVGVEGEEGDKKRRVILKHFT